MSVSKQILRSVRNNRACVTEDINTNHSLFVKKKMHPIIVNSKNGQDHKDKYLHFIKNARLKSVRSFE